MTSPHFLQSDAWQAFQESQGQRTMRLAADDSSWSALCVHEAGPAHTMRLYSPYGPHFASEASLGEALGAIESAAKDAGDVFVRVEPVGSSPEAEENAKAVLTARGYRKVHYAQPEDTIVVDISGGEDEILKALKKKKRSDYRRALRDGIEIRSTDDPAEVGELNRMLALVSERNGVSLRGAEYITAQAESLLSRGAGRLYFATTTASPEGEEIEPTVVAASLCHIGEDTVYYAHAGSDAAWRSKNPNLALVMQMMFDASASGHTRFDLCGVAPVDAPEDHSLASITRFKESLGGERRAYLGTWEKAVRPARYAIYNLARKVLAKK